MPLARFRCLTWNLVKESRLRLLGLSRRRFVVMWLARRPTASRLARTALTLLGWPDGSLQLLVVNHGKRESVEFFEVTQSDEELAASMAGLRDAPGRSVYQ